MNPQWPSVDLDRTRPSGPAWPVWPEPGRGRRPRRRRRFLMVVVVLVSALVAFGTVTFTAGQRSVHGVALPVQAAADSQPAPDEPAEPPAPSPRPKPIYLLADHPLLAAGVTLPDVTCTLPPFRRDTASLNAYYQAFVACMDAAWQPVLAAGGLPHEVPRLNLAEHPGQTGCGNPDTDPALGEFTAMYCPADETLYLPVDRLKKVDRGRASSHLAVLAHEYSHHIQQLSGLLWAAAEETAKAGNDTAEGNQLTRRTELQANCFAGLFLAAAAGRGGITRTLASQAVGEFRNGALPETHGTAAHQASWAKKGFQERTTAVCNTWAAPPAEVS